MLNPMKEQAGVAQGGRMAAMASEIATLRCLVARLAGCEASGTEIETLMDDAEASARLEVWQNCYHQALRRD